MKFINTFVKVEGVFGYCYGFEIDDGTTLIWEEDCHQLSPLVTKIEDKSRVEEITALEFYRWMEKHSRLLLSDD